MGAPASNELVIRAIYVLSNNPETRFADWGAYLGPAREPRGDEAQAPVESRPVVAGVTGVTCAAREPSYRPSSHPG